jgi:hypothetical protein
MSECRSGGRSCILCQGETVAIVEEKEVIKPKNKKTKAVQESKEIKKRKKSKGDAKEESSEALGLVNDEQNSELTKIHVVNVEDIKGVVLASEEKEQVNEAVIVEKKEEQECEGIEEKKHIYDEGTVNKAEAKEGPIIDAIRFENNDDKNNENIEGKTSLTHSKMSKVVFNILNSYDSIVGISTRVLRLDCEKMMNLSEGALKERHNAKLFASIITEYKTHSDKIDYRNKEEKIDDVDDESDKDDIIVLEDTESKRHEDKVTDIARGRIFKSNEMQEEKGEEADDETKSEPELTDHMTSKCLKVNEALEKYTYIYHK